MTDHRHVSVDDPIYRGFRIERLWVLTGIDPTDDTEGLIVVPLDLARMFHVSEGPAMASDEVRANNLRELARHLATELGMKFRLILLTPEGSVEEFG